MNLKSIYKISGILSVIAGVLAALCVMDIKLTFPGLLLSILGFIFSSANIFLNAKYEFTESRFSLGYIGMIFSSVPVVLLMLVIFRHK